MKMREILFRGQILKKGEKVTIGGEPVAGKWIYGGIFAPNIQCDRCIITSYDYLQKYPVYADTVGQYTGLTDKTVTKIFEGDIIKGNAKDTFIVVYENRIAGFMAYREHARITPCMNYGTMQCYEVIGNIYDNPSLMEDSQ